MHRAALHPACSLPRPTKRRRRTATAVLAGDFDLLPQRDFFTDMANSSDPLNPYNSVLGHGPGILFDVRSQHEKDALVAREQQRLYKNARRREWDSEARRAKDEQNIKKVSRSVNQISELVRVDSMYTPENPRDSTRTTAAYFPTPSGTFPAPLPLARRVTMQAPPPILEFSPSQDAPSVPRLPDWSMSQWPPAPLRSVVPMAPALAITVAPPPTTQLPNSPPTPSRSISSYTSHTSSKRPRTPDDDEMLLSPSRMHLDSRSAFQVYDTTGNLYSPDAEVLAAVGADKDMPPNTAANGISGWFTSEPSRADVPSGTPTESHWAAAQPTPSYFDRLPTASASTAHRRRALSVAALLSPSVLPPTISSSPPAIFVPPPAIPVSASVMSTPPAIPTKEPLVISTPSPEIPARPPSVSATLRAPETQPQSHTPRAQPVEQPIFGPSQGPGHALVATSTVDSVCLSPLADGAPPGGGLAYDFHGPGRDVAGTLITQDPPIAVELHLDDNYGPLEREGSLQAECNARDMGRASKAMRIIESDDELTELDEFAAPRPRNEFAPPRPRKPAHRRPATRKGWKGWVEVEVEEETVPYAITSDLDPTLIFPERRTRSGRQFDA